MSTVDIFKGHPAEPSVTAGGRSTYNLHHRYGTTTVTVPEGTLVMIQDLNWGSTRGEDPRGTFPNMVVEAGNLVIPLCDMVAEVVRRAEPVDLARALWTEDDAVQTEFMRCMANRYTDGALNDDARRRFLAMVQAAVHSEAVDKVDALVTRMEHEATKAYVREVTLRDYLTRYERVLQVVEHLCGAEVRARVAESCGEVYAGPEGLPDTHVAGEAWNQARAHWREELARLFPGPDVPRATGGPLDPFD